MARNSDNQRALNRAYMNRWRKANPEKQRDRFLRTTYGITLEQFEQKVIEQNGVCAICGHTCTTGNNLCQDHDHDAAINRGLLCRACNIGLGSFRDDTERLQRAIDYLNEWQSEA